MTLARQAIAASTTDLLVVGLETLGRTVVNDISNVRFVYAHAECTRGDHNLTRNEHIYKTYVFWL
jgi:hypothetical protein